MQTPQPAMPFKCILREFNVGSGGSVTFGCNKTDLRQKVNRQFEFITLEPVHFDDADEIKLCAKRNVDEIGLAVLRCFPTYFATGKVCDITRLKVLGPALAAMNTETELRAAVEETGTLFPRTEKEFVGLFAGRPGSCDAANARYWNGEPQWIMATRMIKHGIMKPAPEPKDDALIRTLRFYPVVAHFKHSCDPNCRLVVNEDTHELTVTLLRPMSSGESVTISYILTEAAATLANTPWTLRRDVLLKQYGFICDCTLCSVQSQRGITFDEVLAALS